MMTNLILDDIMEKTNCWEFKKCGREPGGSKVGELGVCIAATDETQDGRNCGTNAGRVCWALVGTLCGGQVQGTFAIKIGNCLKCEFYKTVKEQEKTDFLFSFDSMKDNA
jgi:hypothetical protein